MYGTYASKAFLRSNVAPLTYVRLLGQQSPDATGVDGQAGWKTLTAAGAATTPITGAAGGGAFGFFVAPSASAGAYTGTAGSFRLGAVIYVQSGSVQLSGAIAGDSSHTLAASATAIASDSSGNFTLLVDGNTNGSSKFTVNFNDDSADFIRKKINTNPQLTSTRGDFYPSASFEDYWLGESFEQFIRDNGLHTGNLIGMIVGLASGSADSYVSGPHNKHNIPSQEAIAGWFVGQDLGAAADFDVTGTQKLFRLIGREPGS